MLIARHQFGEISVFCRPDLLPFEGHDPETGEPCQIHVLGMPKRCPTRLWVSQLVYDAIQRESQEAEATP